MLHALFKRYFYKASAYSLWIKIHAEMVETLKLTIKVSLYMLTVLFCSILTLNMDFFYLKLPSSYMYKKQTLEDEQYNSCGMHSFNIDTSHLNMPFGQFSYFMHLTLHPKLFLNMFGLQNLTLHLTLHITQ